MKKVFMSIGVAGVVGVVVYRKINKTIEEIRKKREEEIRRIQSEWHSAGFDAGYDAGKYDAKLDSIREQNEHSNED